MTRALAAGLWCIGAIWLVVFGLPLRARWTEQLGERAWQVNRALALADAAVLRHPVTVDSLESARRQLLALAPRILSGQDPATIEAALTAVVAGGAASAGLDLGPLQTTTDSMPGTPLVRVATRGDATGDLQGLITFLNFLAAGPLAVVVDQLSIEQSQPAAGDDVADALHIRFALAGIGLRRERAP